MYFINDNMMAEKLGLGYNELRTYEVNDKVKAFLNSIQVTGSWRLYGNKGTGTV